MDVTGCHMFVLWKNRSFMSNIMQHRRNYHIGKCGSVGHGWSEQRIFNIHNKSMLSQPGDILVTIQCLLPIVEQFLSTRKN